jgi:thymidylate synthase
MVKSLWQDEYLRTAVLPSCVWSTEWDVTDGKLNLLVHQRSCDVPLGLPFNVTQYATFLLMIAQVTNLKPGTIKYSIKDAHIYVNQIDGIKEQIKREDRYNELLDTKKTDLKKMKDDLQKKMDKIEDKKSKEFRKLDTEFRIIDMILEPSKPEMQLNPNIKDFFKFDNSIDLKDVKLVNYKHMGKIDFPIAQ